MGKIRVNYKSDLPPVQVKFKINDAVVDVPDHDFIIRFFVEGSPGTSFVCSYKDGEYVNCQQVTQDTLVCYVDNHHFGCGRLCCEFIDLTKDRHYEDGVMKTVTPSTLDVVLVDGVGDDTVEVLNAIFKFEPNEIENIVVNESQEDGGTNTVTITQTNGEVVEFGVKNGKTGAKGDTGAYRVAGEVVAPDFAIVNDLTTGGETDALSAEMGKVLKQIVDRLSEINIDGIKGFVPISSLNDLPASPTSEQKGMAYILDNALYIYVGNSGDTLDGKYQSTPLVTLDWNDKHYAPLSYNGLGRITLKKNMISNKNVLTAAMVSIANTEYFIQYDYDLKGEIVTLPANASLIFMGGSITNGTLIGNNTRIQAKKGVMIFNNITIQGTWDVDTAYSSWFWMWKNGYKIASVAEGAKILYKGTDNIYYELSDLTLVGSDYYVTSTLVEDAVVENSIKVTATTYATFKIEGDETDYIAAPPTIPGAFDGSGYAQYDDTAALQNLFDLRAKKTVLEDGVYMVKCNSKTSHSNNVGLYFDGVNDSELVLEGWIKAIPNNLNGYHILDIIGCNNIRISGKGGVQGDLLEHTATGGEYGMCLSISNTKGLYVEGVTFAYAWGDCIYSHWWNHGRENVIVRGNNQKFHTYKNVNIIYGGRTGYACELADNVVIDGCYFYGTGRVRGKATNSAVDVEPFNYADTPQRYVMNYEFKNNVFKNSANGIRLERCVNCSVHDNFFDFGWSGVTVIWHKDVSYDITGPNDRGWLKSYLRIFNNHIKRCSTGVSITSTDVAPRKYSENVEIYGNTLVSCRAAFSLNKTLKSSRINNNTTYGCGQWTIDAALIDCDIYNNRNYGCVMPELTTAWGAGYILKFGDGVFDASKGSTFHHNHFSLDYGVSIFGLGADGKEEFYHGLPNGNRYVAVQGVNLGKPEKVHFFDNDLSDDFTLNYGSNYDYQTSAYFQGGFCSAKNEDNEVFLEGDIFRSKLYGDEGVVIKGGMISNSWLNNAREFEPYMEVVYGEIIKLGDCLKICNKSGICGETLTNDQGECGTAGFTTVAAYLATEHSAARIKIRFTKSGFCSSDSRPTTFLYEGRRMHETDTGRDIVYNGTAWVYENYIPKVEVAGTTPAQVLAPNTFYQFTDDLTSLNLSLGAHDGVTFFAGRFSTDDDGCVLTPASPITLESGAPTIEGGKTYEFNIIDNIMMLKEI